MKESNDILVLFESLNNHEVFTPPRLAKQMLELFPENVWTHPEYKFLDPCVKSGVFLREMFYKLFDGLNGKGKFTADDGITYDLNDNHQRINHIFKNMLYGIATSELTGYVSRRTLYGVMKADSDKQIAAVESFERSKNFTDWTEQQRLDFIGRNQFNDYYDHTIFKTKEYEGFEKEGNIFYPTEEVTQKVAEEGNYLIEDTYFPFIDERTKHRKILDIKEQKMKFDVIIGNPPYQISPEGGTRDIPVYNRFVEHAKKLNPRYLSMIIPSRWMASGLGLTDFRKSMLEDKRIRKMVDFPVATDAFAGVEIKGGVCYFLWERDSEGFCEVISSRGGKTFGPVERDLGEYDVFVRDGRSVEILKKILSHQEPSITEILSVDKEFGWTSNFSGFHETQEEGDVPLHYITKGKRNIGWISRSEIVKSSHLVDTWKVMIPQAGSDGGKKIPDPVLGQPMVASTPSVCTQSFLFFYVTSEAHAKSVESYLRTRFFRFLVSLRKITQHATRSTYQWVPKQNWDIEWTDEKLYKKYDLTQDEIDFIESMIKPME